LGKKWCTNVVLLCVRENNKRTSSEQGLRLTGQLRPAWSMVTPMIDSKHLDDLARRLTDAMPAGIREMQQDMEKNLRSILQASLSKLDLVTREEFDVQARVLARTREKLDQLEKVIAALEARARLDGPESNAPPDEDGQ
jgi:BMFP domain-containing protein YqiC